MSTPLVNVKIPRFKAGRKNLIESGYITLEDMAAVENPHQLLKYRGVGQVTLRRLQSEAERLGLEWKSKPKPKAPLPLIKNRYAMKDKLADALAEVRVLKNEIARLNGQTNWVCKCGGTDCEGQRENAALRKDKERLEVERCECLRTMDLALNSNAGLREENAALRSAAVEVCALARVWVTVWGDKLSAESIQRLEQLEKQVLKEAQP